jgi:hypothetical protein
MAPAAARDKDKLDRFRRDVEQCMGVAFEELDDATSRGSSATSSVTATSAHCPGAEFVPLSTACVHAH